MNNSHLKIGIAGVTGRVGRLILNELQSGNHEGLEFSGGLARDVSALGTGYFVTDNAAALFERSDIVIDFTLPDITVKNAQAAAEAGKPIIIGTTGLSEEQEAVLAEAAQKTPIVYAANMSLGVNILLALVEQAAAALSEDWDIEIFESHHKHKIDAPSGTALALGKVAAAARNVNHEDKAVYSRSGERKAGDIGYAVSRGGDVAGEHAVTFYTAGERVELSHKATDRAIFARGALHAASWAANQKPGLYSMKDVLGI